MKLLLDKNKDGFDVFLITHLGNGKLIGQFEYDVDGFCKWWPIRGDGYMDAEFLQLIVDKLNELNAEWKEEIEAMCNGQTDYDVDTSFP